MRNTKRRMEIAPGSEVYTRGPAAVPCEPPRRPARGSGRGWTGGAPLRIALLGLVLLSSSCQNIFSLQDDRRLGAQAYTEILGPETLVTSGPTYQMATRVTQRLVAAARVEDPKVVDAFEWEVRVIQNDATVNAFCLPGGKMAVYTGILPVAVDETGLAVVMGHEIAHAIERHGTEAMTRRFGADVLLQILFEGTEREWADLANGLIQLRYGRGDELEADRKGLRIMARAGYDPRAAVSFWTRMSSLGGSAPPEILSTHPSDGRRISQLQSLLPAVIPIYEANRANNP